MSTGASSEQRVLRVWIDAQLPPALARWMPVHSAVDVRHTFELGLVGASDTLIFAKAREAGAVVVTKDADFVELQYRRGVPPQVVWVTTGNVSNASLRRLFASAWPGVVALLRSGEALVELGDRRSLYQERDDR